MLANRAHTSPPPGHTTRMCVALLCILAIASQNGNPWSPAHNPVRRASPRGQSEPKISPRRSERPFPEPPKSLLGIDLTEFTGGPAKILNLNPYRLTSDNVKKGYIRLARVYHPDKFSSKSKREQAHKVFLHLVDARDKLLAKLERERNLPRYEIIPFHWM